MSIARGNSGKISQFWTLFQAQSQRPVSSRFFRTRSTGAKFKSVPVRNWLHITPISRIEWTLMNKGLVCEIILNSKKKCFFKESFLLIGFYTGPVIRRFLVKQKQSKTFLQDIKSLKQFDFITKVAQFNGVLFSQIVKAFTLSVFNCI